MIIPEETVHSHTAHSFQLDKKNIQKNLFDQINNFLRKLQGTYHVFWIIKALVYVLLVNSHGTLLGKFWNKTSSLTNVETFKILVQNNVGVCFYTKYTYIENARKHLFLLHIMKMFWWSQCVLFGTKFESVCSDHPKATTFFMMTKMVTLKGKCTKDFTNPNESEQAIFDKT